MEDGQFRTFCRSGGCRVHLLHRHRRTRLEYIDKNMLKSCFKAVTSSQPEAGREIPQAIRKIRMTVCEIFQNGWRSSQKISKKQKCLHPHTFLMTQILNVLRKRHLGSTVFILICQKTEIAKYACDPR